MTQFQELWQPPNASAIKHGTEEMAKARALSAPQPKVTVREQAYIDSLSAFFSHDNLTYDQRAAAYNQKMDLC
jgi:hypothetical protein